jgi:gliding motility-associated-like protein
MKNYTLLLFSILLINLYSFSQIVITPGGTAMQLATNIVAPGITVTNTTMNCAQTACGTFTGNLQAGGSQLSNGGIVMTTGSAANADGPNATGSSSTAVAGYDFSDPHLTTQPGAGNPAPNRDNCVLEFDMQPSCAAFNVNFVFGSEEYPEFVTGSFNDGFGIFISGPNPAGGNYNNYNVARLPNGQLVSIDNVNANTNAQYYNTNNTGVIQYDGYTDGLTAQLSVIPCSTYHVKIIIADAGDESYDSGLFLGVGSFSCNAPLLTVNTPAPICGGQNAVITATATGTTGTYTWSDGQTGASITVNPATTTTYTVTYSINGCSDVTATSTVTVNPPIQATFTSLGPYCATDTPGLLPTTSDNSIQGTWSPATINTAIANTTTYNFTPDPNSCGLPNSMTVVVNPQGAPTFAQLGPYCQNEAVVDVLPTTSTNGVVGTWTPAIIGSSIPGNTTYNFVPTVAQCTSNASMVINVIPIAAPPLTSNVTTGCTPLNVSFSTPAIPNVSYNYTMNNNSFGTNPSANYSFTNAGCYDITLTASNQGCIQSTTITDMICVETAPSVFFSASPTILENSSQQVVFSNNTIGGESYLWDFGDGSTSTSLNNTHLYSNINGNFNVSLTSSTPLGCTSSYLVTLTYIDKPVFYIPNTFTPDEDQFNQTWGPVFTSGFDPFNFDLYIYNRWGELIWESHDAKERWDGSYGKKGTKVPSGLYSYKIRFKPTTTDEKVTVSGHINLMR